MKLQIGKLFELIKEFKSTNNLDYHEISFQGEELGDLFEKEDDIFEMFLSNGEILKPAGNHVIIVNGREIFVKDIKAGEELSDGITVDSITKIKEASKVFDINVNNGTSLYTLGGLTHHNSDKIPEGTYIIMASNVDDTGVDEIPENYDFHMMNFETPNKDDFFDYIKAKYVAEDDEEGSEDREETPSGIKMKPEVFNAFYEVLNGDIFGKNDEASDTRLSPRRTEQMLTYVDAMTPVTSEEDVRALLSFVKTNLSNYLTGDQFKGTQVIMNTVRDIIAKTSPEFAEIAKSAAPFGKSDWKKSFAHELKAKIILGENRKYIPVVAGDPGIGKTSVMCTVASEQNLGLICVDVSNMSAEDFTGMPIGKEQDGEMTTSFSEPSLYNFIMKQYNIEKPEHFQEGRPYNVILLFDEISRTTPAVFNAMRKVLLEKEFSAEYPLPSDILVTGALNPQGEGTQELTSHVRDVFDLISGTAKFSEVIDWATKRESLSKINQGLGFEASLIVGNIITSIAKEFQSEERPDSGEKLDNEEAPFWWTVNGETFYISGREYTEAIALIVAQMEDRLLDMDWDPKANYEEADYDAFMTEALAVTANAFGQTLNMVVTKMKVSNFVPTLIGKIVNNPKYKTAFSPMKEKKTADELPLDELFLRAGGTVDSISKRMIGTYLGYTASPTQFGQDYGRLLNILTSKFSANDMAKLIIDLAQKLNQIFVELDYPEAVSNAFNDNMFKQTKAAIKVSFEDPESTAFDDMELIDKILEVF